ncbi:MULTISPECIES: sensor histidine kinase [unclassified Rhizobium]|uniref:sensor histidine kinase n=1 Tax=unclassified Rhizobium TaxID=2613769 RepID=UPI0028A197F4
MTDRRRHDAETDFILAEMRHRIKNLSAVIQSVVKNIRTEDPTLIDFKEGILGRIATAFRGQEIAASGVASDLEQLVRDAVGQTVSERLACAGPPTDISASKVSPVSMIFHELGTNAVKHGAASVESGRIDVTWEMVDDPGERRLLVCHWQEAGGPRVNRPSGTGYGSDLIQGLASHIRGQADLRYPPDGFTATIRIPL